MLLFSMCFAKSAYYRGKKIQVNTLFDLYKFYPGENGPAISRFCNIRGITEENLYFCPLAVNGPVISRFFSANYNLLVFAQNPHLMIELPAKNCGFSTATKGCERQKRLNTCYMRLNAMISEQLTKTCGSGTCGNFAI